MTFVILIIHNLKMKNLSIIVFLTFSLSLSAQLTLSDLRQINSCRDFEKVTGIALWNMQNKDVKKLTKKIYRFKNLKSIQISGASFDSAGIDYSSFKKLEVLVLKDCSLNIVPASVFLCTGITNMDISDNQIKTITKEFETLTNLQFLDFSGNEKIEFQADISKSENLEILRLTGCQLTEIPAWVFSCKSLTDLIIGKNPIKEVLPDIGKLVNLKQLTLDETQISDLPNELKKCTKLESIYIKATPLSKNEKRVKELEKELGKTLVLYPTMF
jgi:Leucine-rich repeat (LRR) protein